LVVHTGILPWLWGLAHAAYLGAVALALRSRGSASPRRSARAVALILAVGAVPRLLLLPTAPALSEDLYRYLWDGRLVAHGINPFPRPPADRAFGQWHDAIYERLNHPSVPTIYPPVAQGLFAVAWKLGGTPLAWKAILFGLEAGLVAGLAALLRRRGLPPERLLLYYWNPLVVVECYGSGHVDLAAAALLVAALALLEGSRHERARQAAAGAALGAAVLVKLVPLLLLPALARRRAWRAIAAAAAIGALLYVPFRGAGPMLWEGLRTYARHWEYNGPVYAAIRPLFRDGDAPRVILAAALAVAVLAIAARARTLSGAALASWTAFLLLSPTVYPWYLIPAIALLPLHPDPGLFLFSGTAALTYLPLPLFRITGVWRLPGWISWVEYGSLAAAWILAWAWRRMKRGQARREAWASETIPT
jgi:hypothetical protein